ncbi:unnamed protein product [Microthlaspi erraticum]|uniref:Uncharacterized protein n=1 Tax=Microthlaspi erraticum TaxID=1685480 RepID=A0A6D2KCT5_9BRAS|nr:unnamed protein product [Microthlaspi erraticum]
MCMKSSSIVMPPMVKASGFEERRVGELVGDDGGDESVVEEDGRVWDSAEDSECRISRRWRISEEAC